MGVAGLLWSELGRVSYARTKGKVHVLAISETLMQKGCRGCGTLMDDSNTEQTATSDPP